MRPINHLRSQSAKEDLAARGGFGPFGSGETLPMSQGVTMERHTSIIFELKSPTEMPTSPAAIKLDSLYSPIVKNRATEEFSKPGFDGDKENWMSRLFGWKSKSGEKDEEEVFA